MNLLVLLIGNNSMANYALIKYFSEKRATRFPKVDSVMLIYSKSTEKRALSIKTFFENVKFIDVNIGQNEKNIAYIIKKVTAQLESLNLDFIHLNYTGGTKSMGLGAFLAIENYKKCKEKYFSDINHQYKLFFKRGDEFPEDGSLSDFVNFSIQDLAKLEVFEILNEKRENSKFFNINFYLFLIEQVLKNKKFLKSWEKCKNKEISDCGECLSQWKEQLKEFVDLDNLSKDEWKELNRFVNGIFLEEFVFYVLNKYKEELKITDVAWNVEIKKRRKFEVDVVATKGVDIYVFSCTTDKYDLIKQKSFEVITRAQQFGGIAGIPILVSCVNKRNKRNFADDMIEREEKNRFILLGRDDIKNEKIFLSALKGIIK